VLYKRPDGRDQISQREQKRKFNRSQPHTHGGFLFVSASHEGDTVRAESVTRPGQRFYRQISLVRPIGCERKQRCQQDVQHLWRDDIADPLSGCVGKHKPGGIFCADIAKLHFR